MHPRAVAAFFTFVAALAVLTGWAIGTGGWRPPFQAKVPDPASFRAERWRDVRLVFTGGVDDHLLPRYRVQKVPVGGVARLVTLTRAAEKAGPRLSFSIHASLDYSASSPVPEDASEELARRRQAVLQHLRAGGTDLIVLGPDGERELLIPSERGWRSVGKAAVVAFGGRLPLGLAVSEAVTEDTLGELRSQGAQFTLLFEKSGTPTNVDRRGFDLVVISGPDRTVGEETLHHVSFRRDASFGRVLDLRLPVAGAPEELRRFPDLHRLYRSHERLVQEARQAAGGDAKQRVLQGIWDRLAPEFEAHRRLAFVHSEPLRVMTRLDPSDPGRILERNHLAEDESRYAPIIDDRKEPHRTPAHPGSESCQSCHRAIYDAWSDSPHALAWQRLEEVGAQRSPACVTCHSTGFSQEDPQGWSRMADLKGHENVGCTACHQPSPEDALPDHPWGKAGGCQSCHTRYWAPFFDEERAKARIACPTLVEMRARLREGS